VTVLDLGSHSWSHRAYRAAHPAPPPGDRTSHPTHPARDPACGGGDEVGHSDARRRAATTRVNAGMTATPRGGSFPRPLGRRAGETYPEFTVAVAVRWAERHHEARVHGCADAGGAADRLPADDLPFW